MNPLNCLADEQRSAWQIDVLPAKAKYLSPSETGGERHDEDEFQMVSLQLAEKCQCFIRCQCPAFRPRQFGGPYSFGNVARNQVHPLRVGEGVAQYSVDLDDRSGGRSLPQLTAHQLNVARCQRRQFDSTNQWSEMDAHDLAVPGQCRCAGAIADLDGLKPFVQPLLDRPGRVGQIDALSELASYLVALREHFALTTAIHGAAPAPAGDPTEINLGNPHSVRTLKHRPPRRDPGVLESSTRLHLPNKVSQRICGDSTQTADVD